MNSSGKTRRAVGIVILAISGLAWALLLAGPGQMAAMQHCAMSLPTAGESVKMWLAMHPLASVMGGWGLMVMAMMLPKLRVPIQYIYDRSLRRMRFLSIVSFVLGYLGVWMVAGIVLNALVILATYHIPGRGLCTLLAGFVTLIWQCSPAKQGCLNRGHMHPALAAFGPAAIVDAFRFGAVHGTWCVGAGWALMMFPLLVPVGHLIAMFLVALIMVSEHLERPRVPRWHIFLPKKLLKIIVAQSRIRLAGILH